MPDSIKAIQDALSQRFGENFEVDPKLAGLEELKSIAAHRVQRSYALVEEAEALVVLGLSLQVMSGLRFVRAAHKRGIPVVIGVPARNLEAWRNFADEFATELPGDIDQIGRWLARLG